MKQPAPESSRPCGSGTRTGPPSRRRAALAPLLMIAATGIVSSVGLFALQTAADGSDVTPAETLEETRLMMDKWIETQQIISRERNDWQQGRGILAGRLELVSKEVATLEEKLRQAQASVVESDRKRTELLAENEQLKTAGKQLTDAIGGLEGEVRRLSRSLPEPIRTRLQPLSERIPEDPAVTRVSAAERFQNVLGILNEVNKANNDITISYEVHDLADGTPSEVKALYVGLAQAYFVSARGEAGIGHPTADGWKWEPSTAVGNDVLMALDILEGQHSPAFVPLPVTLQ